MMYCKSLIYHPIKQEAIVPIHPNFIVKWDVSRSPHQIGQQQVLFHWRTIPQIAILPNLEQFAVTHNGIHQSYIDIYKWADMTCLEQIPVPHATYQEIDPNDPFCSHDLCCTLSHLSITTCGRYLVVIEEHGDIHLLALATKIWTRLKRRTWSDYSEMIVFDRKMQFMVFETILTDAVYSLYRIDDLINDQMTLLDEFEGVAACHRGALQFHPDDRAIVRTGYHCNIDYYIFEPEPNGLERRWTDRLPYIQHSHSSKHPWQSSLVFKNASTIMFAAGCKVVQIDTKDGNVMAEYHTDSVVNAIAYDAERDLAIAATNYGLELIQ